MKRFVFLLCSILGFTMMSRAEIIITTDTESSVAIAEVKSITFDGDFNTGNMVINFTDGTSQSTPIASIKQLTFKSEQASAIAPVASAVKPTISVKGDMMTVSTDGGCATLYDITGKQMLQTALENGTTVLSLGQIPAGVYVMNINGHTVKFQKK